MFKTVIQNQHIKFRIESGLNYTETDQHFKQITLDLARLLKQTF